MSLYRNILTQAWITTWNHKYLWFFGLFAAFLVSGGEYEILSSGFGDTTFQGSFSWMEGVKRTGIFSQQALLNLGDIAKNDTVSFIIILFIAAAVIALTLFLVWLSVISQAALVNNTAKHLDNSSVDFKDGVTVGMKNFWPVLGLNVILKIVFFAVLILFGLPVILVSSSAGIVFANLFYILMFVVFVAAVLAATFIIKFGIGYAVIKKEKPCKALKYGWELFVKNWIVSMEMALLLFFLSLIISLAYLILMLVFAIPFALLAIIFIKVSVAAFLLLMFLALVFYVASLALVGSTLTTFQVASWTILFLRLIDKGAESKLVRVVNNLLDKS